MLVAAAMMVQSTGKAASVEQTISFTGHGGVPIAGTLVLPASASADHPVPAMLLIQGSGPTDRDGNQPPNFQTDLLRQLAEVLADEDIATLRFDKRGLYANRSSMPTRQEELPAFFSWSAFVGDAAAGFAFLAAHPAIASGRIGVLGHSEGGLIALDLANKNQRQPKVLILAATAGRPMGKIIQDQLSAALERQHATAEQRQFFLNDDQRIRSEILATGKVPPDVPPGLAALYPSYLGPFYKSQLVLDPVALAANFKGPILVINGAADTQVSATRDAARFSSGLASRKDGSEIFTPAAVSHNLKTVANNDDPGIAGNLDTRVKDVIVSWLKTAL